MYLIGIPQWSCLYQLCENVTFLATGVNKVLKNNCQCHLMIKWMYDVCTLYVHTCCEICFSIDINIPDNIEIIESPNEDSTNNDDDHHDNQSDQPKKSVRLYDWGKSDEGKIMKISRNLSVTDEIELLRQQIAVFKRHLFTKRTQISAYNEVKDNLKQNDLLIHNDYSGNYNNKQQWVIQSAYFGHASFRIFTTCCYFKDEVNAIRKEAITVTSETSDHARNAPASCLQKVIHFVREKHAHLPLKLNVIVWSDDCAAQFRLWYVFFLLSKFEALINLSWFCN